MSMAASLHGNGSLPFGAGAGRSRFLSEAAEVPQAIKLKNCKLYSEPAYIRTSSNLEPAYAPIGSLPELAGTVLHGGFPGAVKPPPGLEKVTGGKLDRAGATLRMMAAWVPQHAQCPESRDYALGGAGVAAAAAGGPAADEPSLPMARANSSPVASAPGSWARGDQAPPPWGGSWTADEMRARSYTWPLSECSVAELYQLWGGAGGGRHSGSRRHRQGERRRRCQLMIATHLHELEQEDPDCILFARQINKLGFKSPEILKEHFEQYGPVVKVLVSNSHEKSSGAPFPVRLRPSGMGFVLMEHPRDAARVLAAGAMQTVNGLQIHVRAFQSRLDSGNLKEQGSDQEAEIEAVETPSEIEAVETMSETATDSQ